VSGLYNMFGEGDPIWDIGLRVPNANALDDKPLNNGDKVYFFEKRMYALNFFKIHDSYRAARNITKEFHKMKDDEFDAKMLGLRAEKEEYFSNDTSVYKKLQEIVRKEKVKVLETHLWNEPLLVFHSDFSPRVICKSMGFNLLHLCCFLGTVRVAKLLLRLVGDVSFVALLYNKSTTRTELEDLALQLLFNLLNHQGGKCKQTPLHIAAMFGHVEMVELLLEYPQCRRYSVDALGKTPIEVIGTLAQPKISAARGEKIKYLLRNEYFIPLIRTNDDESTQFADVPIDFDNIIVFSSEKLDAQTEREIRQLAVSDYVETDGSDIDLDDDDVLDDEDKCSETDSLLILESDPNRDDLPNCNDALGNLYKEDQLSFDEVSKVADSSNKDDLKSAENDKSRNGDANSSATELLSNGTTVKQFKGSVLEDFILQNQGIRILKNTISYGKKAEKLFAKRLSKHLLADCIVQSSSSSIHPPTGLYIYEYNTGK